MKSLRATDGIIGKQNHIHSQIREISLNSANVHIIPKDDLIEDKIDEVNKGSLIEMKGYLVELSADDGWHWRSSLRRDDTAGGSCELFWVEELTILDAE
ncbi:MAG: hypothetical protein MZV64_66605 [Ignavibacteriales bacterium]|nr:hypothetical protein [Ignavibacteriales bacterium]